MASFLTALVLFIIAGASLSTACLYEDQADVRFDQISGSWWQAYYSKDSKFADLISYEDTIFGVNVEKKEFQSVIKFTEVLGAKKSPIRRIIRNTVNWEEEPSIKDRIFTDYETYFIFIKCRGGSPTVEDVLLRKGMSSLPLKKIKEVADALQRVGVDFYSFDQRRENDSRTIANPK